MLGGALLLCVWAALRLMPRLPPSVRSWLWRLASLKLLALLLVGGSAAWHAGRRAGPDPWVPCWWR